MKQHVYDPKVVAQLHISKIVNLMEHQEINTFLKLSNDYSEDLIRVFYVWLGSRERSTLCYKMGKNSYHFTEDSWGEVFGISVFSHQATLSDQALHRDFDWKSYLNSCLKAPRPDGSLDKLSTTI